MFVFFINFLKRLFGKKPQIVVVPTGNNGGNTVSTNKYALLVGINKYAIPGNDLRGCVNDVMLMADLLCKDFGFPADNIRLLTDERATQKNILERLEWLVSVAKPGDQLVFHYSGHGSQVRDRDGDELDDQMDEILCPHDLDWDNLFLDDLMALFFKRVPEGAPLTFIADCCHSGTLSKEVGNPHKVISKFIAPPPDIAWRSGGRALPVKALGRRGMRSKSTGDVHIVDQRHILLSGCKDDQTSADAFIGGKFHGALTYYLVDAIKKVSGNWKDVHASILSGIRGQYSQVPQLSGSETNLNAKPFGS